MMGNFRNRRQGENLGRLKTSKRSYDADYIRASINPIEFYRHELPTAIFKKFGWNCGGLCPFHSDNKTGNFRVNIATGAFKCYGRE